VRAAVAAEVAPAGEEVLFRDVPLALLGRLVVVQSDVHGVGDLAQGLGELHIAGKGVDGILTVDDEGVDLASVHVGDQGLDAGEVVGTLVLDLAVGHGLTDGAESVVDESGEGVDIGRLAVAHHDRGASLGRHEVVGRGLDHLVGLRVAEGALARRCGLAGLLADGLREREREGADLRRGQRNPMVGRHARRRDHGLYRVEAQHLRRALDRSFGSPALAPLAGQAHRLGAVAERVGVEGENRVGLEEAVMRAMWVAEGEGRAGTLDVTAEGGEFDPLRVGQRLLHLFAHPIEGGRVGGAAEHAKLAAAVALGRGLELAKLGEEGLLVGGDLRRAGPLHELLRTIRVVEAEHGGLSVGVGSAEGLGVVGVAVDLGRATVEAGHLKTHDRRAEMHRGPEVLGNSGDEVLRPLGVRLDLLALPPGKASRGESGRCAHELHEAATARLARGGMGRLGEFALQ